MSNRPSKKLTPRAAPAKEGVAEEKKAVVVDEAKKRPAGSRECLVTKKSFIDGKIVMPGETVFYVGEKIGSNLKLIED